MLGPFYRLIARLRRKEDPKIPAVYTLPDLGLARPGDYVGPMARGTYYQIEVTGIHWLEFARRMANAIPGGLMLCYDGPRPGRILYAVGIPAPAALLPVVKAAEAHTRNARYQR